MKSPIAPCKLHDTCCLPHAREALCYERADGLGPATPAGTFAHAAAEADDPGRPEGPAGPAPLPPHLAGGVPRLGRPRRGRALVGGGYVVATRLLGPRLGVVSGCALLVDYVLTISVSIAAGGDAVFSVLPNGEHWAGVMIFGLPLKLQIELAAFFLLVVLNLRGVKESVTILMPVFMVFLATHALVIGAGILGHLGRAAEVAHEISTGFH